ncbi:MAG: RNA pseudouridine synthase [Deltaproteobacteria bacterium]|jgi:23S rRNA pseudouridine1911/1915/1917 synthase|nr:RNA pseudouridine synthase [Deltaproteobacteria bacterium]
MVIFEDRQLLVVQKPPLWLSQADNTPRPDVLTWARRHVEVQSQKPGRAYLGLCHRLDWAAGGLMALAKTSKAAKRLGQQFLARTIGKYYLALIIGEPPLAGRLNNELYRSGHLTRLAVKGEPGTLARLEYRVLARGLIHQRKGSLLSIKLMTGFKHQIRAQLAELGFPLVGDRRYGGFIGPSEAIGLWAYRLELDSPVGQTPLSFQAWPGDFWPWNAWRGPNWTDSADA